MPSPFFRPLHSFRSIAFALLFCVLVLVGIIFFANVLSGRVFVLAETWQANLLETPSTLLESADQTWAPETLALQLELEPAKSPLAFGTQSEVLKLHLQSKGPYRLAYISFFVNASGLKTDFLQNPALWTLYPMRGETVDYLNPIGKGEIFKDGVIRLRLKEEGQDVYKGHSGTVSFALSAPILKAEDKGESTDDSAVSFSITLPKSLGDASFSKDLDWSWAPGHEPSSWLSTGTKYGFAELGL